MNLATLTVEGPERELDTLVSKLALIPDARWKSGDIGRNGIVRSSSGFSATVADTANPKELVLAIRTFLDHCTSHHIAFPRSQLSAELSLGFTVGDSVQFAAGVGFAPPDIRSMVQCGVALSVTAYPTSDNANVETTIAT